jgi:hypothetical protein
VELIIDIDGKVRMLYSDEGAPFIRAVGTVRIARVSHVEPEYANGQGFGLWGADMRPVGGPILRGKNGEGFVTREEALSAERAWLIAHGLPMPDEQPASPGNEGERV